MQRVTVRLLAGVKFLWDSTRYGHWRFYIKYVSRCWWLTLKNWDQLGGESEEVVGREESSVCYQNLLSSLQMGAESGESP